MQALLLARFGIATIVVEKLAERSMAPKAHAMNPRSLEICRAMGLDMDRLNALATPREEGGRVRYATRLTGREFGTLPYERQDDGATDLSPTPLINIAQPEFEEVVFDAVAAEPLVDFRREHEWRSLAETPEGVLSLIDGPDGIYEVMSDTVIATDGAGSPVREFVGIGMDGDPGVRANISITFHADLRPHVGDNHAIIHWLSDPEIEGGLLAYHEDWLWSYVTSHPMTQLDMSAYTDAHCQALIRGAIGGDTSGLEIEVAAVIPWTMRAEVAQSYRAGQVFLVGDAAHRFPPTGGLGLNTGIHEAHNLAWKIAGVRAGWAGGALLESYEDERRPIALANTEQSLANARRLEALADLSCPREIAEDDADFAAWIGEGDRRARIDAAVALQAEHFNSIALQLGFSYGPDQPDLSDVQTFTPRAEVGDRLPHCWLGGGRETSVLDLLSLTEFTLLTGGADGLAPASDLPVPCRAVALSGATAAPADWLVLTGLAEGGAILVRPDGHILCRLADLSPAALADARAALGALLAA